jgi:hypothetical protein
MNAAAVADTLAATALHFNLPVISRDSRILASDLTTIW